MSSVSNSSCRYGAGLTYALNGYVLYFSTAQSGKHTSSPYWPFLTKFRIVLSITIAIYVYTGHHIFQRRKEGVRSLGSSRGMNNPPRPVTNPFAVMNRIERTTEISVRYTTDSEDTVLDQRGTNDSRSSFSSTRKLSVTAQAPPVPHRHNHSSHGISYVSNKETEESSRNYRAAIIADNNARKASMPQPQQSPATYNPNQRRNQGMDGNAAAWSYFKVAFLMFAALFIVWVPSTINRKSQFLTPHFFQLTKIRPATIHQKRRTNIRPQPRFSNGPPTPRFLERNGIHIHHLAGMQARYARNPHFDRGKKPSWTAACVAFEEG